MHYFFSIFIDSFLKQSNLPVNEFHLSQPPDIASMYERDVD
jgi:hypothetical protein